MLDYKNAQPYRLVRLIGLDRANNTLGESKMSYLTRIQLTEANRDKYTALHQEMERLGFVRQIVSTAGETFRLPHGEYLHEETDPVEAVYRKAREAILNAGIEDEPQILLSQTTATWFSGLKRVEKFTREMLMAALEKLAQKSR